MYFFLYSCWLSVEKSTIFGFVAPMLAIILVCIQFTELFYSRSESVCTYMQVNVFFMVLALHTLLKAKRHPIERRNDSTLKGSTELGRLVMT